MLSPSLLKIRRQYIKSGKLRPDPEPPKKIERQKSQELADSEEEIDPELLRQDRMIQQARLRRDQWIQHQVEELQTQQEIEARFRKGSQGNQQASPHNFRPFTAKMQGIRQFPQTKSSIDMMLRSPSQALVGQYKGNRVQSSRQYDKTNNKQACHLVFKARNEQERLKATISKDAVASNGRFDMQKYSNPQWRESDKKKWASPKAFVIRACSGTPNAKKSEKIAAEPYLESYTHRDTKKLVTNVTPQHDSSKLNLLSQRAPFASYTRHDAVWSQRVQTACSIRKQQHLLFSKSIKATEKMDDLNAFAKINPMPICEQDLNQEVCPLDKVRIFLQNQNPLGSIEEASHQTGRAPKRQNTQKSNFSDISYESTVFTDMQNNEAVPSSFAKQNKKASANKPFSNLSPRSRYNDIKSKSNMSTGVSPYDRNQHSAISNNFTTSNPVTSKQTLSTPKKQTKRVKKRKVDLTEENALVLINELYGQKGKSYARPGDIGVTNSRNLLQAVLDEQKILEKIDHKKTYYNSILSELKPKFKYKPKNGFLDEEGYSYRAISDLGFETETQNSIAKKPKMQKKKQQPHNIQLLVSEYFDQQQTAKHSS